MRTTTMIVTGRYPFNAGFYGDGEDQHISNFTTLAGLLSNQLGYRTHAIGKWDVGFVVEETTATFKGFDTFFGYYKACNDDLFHHTTSAECSNLPGSREPVVDMSRAKVVSATTTFPPPALLCASLLFSSLFFCAVLYFARL